MGADPRDLGILPGDDVGVAVLAAVISLVYVYWNVQLCLHLTTDVKVVRFAEEYADHAMQQPNVLANRVLRLRDADLIANRTDFILMPVSLYFAISWAAGVGS